MGVVRTRAWGLITATAVTALALVGLGPTSAAAAVDRCEGGSGVTAVVDFGALGGGAPIVCVSDGGGRSAMDVVQQAGFRLEQVRTQPGFVCAINAKPNPATSCARTPPPNNYWGLFWSDGSSPRWSYSSTGAGGLKVPSGGSIGWRWQDTNSRATPGPGPTTSTPSSSPKPSPTKPPESPEPTPKPTKKPAATASATPGSPTASSSAAAPSGTPTAAAKAAGKAERAEKRSEKRSAKRSDKDERAGKKRDRKAAAQAEGEEAGDEQVTSEAAVQEETLLDPASSTDDGGGALTWAAGGALLLLAAAAGVLARRRRG